MAKYIFYSFIIVVINCSSALAQYAFRHLEREQGLSHLSTTCFLQDQRGYMWIGTRLGLNLYDGSRVKVFYPDASNPNSLPDAYVTSMAESADGRVWVGTSKGICAFEYENGIFSYCENLNLPTETIVASMKFDKKGNLWYTSGSLFCYNLKTRKIKKYSNIKDVPTARILISSTNDIWIASLSGVLYKYNESEDSFLSFNIFTEDENKRMTRPMGMTEISNNRILISTNESGIKVFNTISHKVSTIDVLGENGKSEFIHDLLTRSNGDVWIGSEHGVYILSKHDLEATEPKQRPKLIYLKKNEKDVTSLSDNIVHILYEDQEQGIWVGTFFGGVNYYASALQDFSRLKTDDGSRIIMAREILTDENGTMWIATETNGLFRYSLQNHDNLQHVSLSFNGHNISQNIHALLLDGDSLWLGTFNEGIYIYDIAEQAIIKHYTNFSSGFNFNDKAVVKIFKVDNGDILVGNMTAFYYFDKNTERFDIVEGFESPFVHWIYQSSDGVIWVATLHDGLYRLKKEGTKYLAEHVPTEYMDLTTIFGFSGSAIRRHSWPLHDLSEKVNSESDASLRLSGTAVFGVL